MSALLRLAIALALRGGPASEPTDATAEARAAARSVAIVVAAEGEPAKRLEQRLGEFLGGLPARVGITTSAGFTAAQVIDDPGGGDFAKVWIDATASDHVRLFIVDADADRILIRKVQTPSGLDEVALDEIAYIVEASVDALLRGGTLGVTRESAAAELGLRRPAPAPAAAASAPAPAPAARRWVLGLGASYLARAWAADAAMHGPAIELAFGRRTDRIDAGAVIEGAMIVPIRVRQDDLELRLGGGGVRALAHVAGAIAPGWSWDGRLGAGVDFVRDEGRALLPSATGSDAVTRAIAALALRTGPTVEIGRGRNRFFARLHATLDVELAGVRYVTTEGEPVLEPWRVRPGAALTIGWLRAGGR